MYELPVDGYKKRWGTIWEQEWIPTTFFNIITAMEIINHNQAFIVGE